MQLYKNKKVKIIKNKNSWLVEPMQTTSTPGSYQVFDTVPQNTYKVTVFYNNFEGTVKLWIADINNKLINFNQNLRSGLNRVEIYFHNNKNSQIKIGLLFVNPEPENFYELEKINMELVNIPDNKKRLAIIVPYRNRIGHLKQFIPYMQKYLSGFNYQIFIIHQQNDKLFNRAALFNIGYTIVKDNFDYFCFHDVDLLPELSDYSYPDNPTHLSMHCSQSNYKKSHIFGGVAMINKEQFENINGFSNQFKGWGGEDDNFKTRVMRYYRATHRPGRYLSLPHKIIGRTNPNYKNNVKLYHDKISNRSLDESDGLNNLVSYLGYSVTGYHMITNDCEFKDCKNIIYENKLNYMISVHF
jgi:hypothetical protein